MNKKQRELLQQLKVSADGGAHAQACDGPDRKLAHQLRDMGYATWVGTQWGSFFYAITANGRIALEEGAIA